VNFQQALDKLSSISQTQALKYWKLLTDHQKKHLLHQIEKLDCDVFREQQYLLQTSQKTLHIAPFHDFSTIGNSKNIRLGKELISQGKMGCLIVAGGQGTRLHLNGPKGMVEITPYQHKTLFQLFAEKTLAAGMQAKKRLPLAIMTSPQNHEDIIKFFKEKNFFGLDENQLSFFCQTTLPLLDNKGNLFLESPHTIAEGPDGNGSALHQFFHSGLWKAWYMQGVRYLNFILIDNPLADPFDAELVGFHDHQQCDIVIKCTSRASIDENVGILVKENDRIGVIEYTEMPEKERYAIDNRGCFLHYCANISLFSFSMNFIQKIALENSLMPLHKAFKTAKYLSPNGKTIQARKPMAWKFEKFIFDILSQASTVEALLYPRELCFAPLKNLHGQNSLTSVRNALLNRDQKAFAEVSGLPCLSDIEVSQDFYYPTPELLAEWKGKQAPDRGYLSTNSHPKL